MNKLAIAVLFGGCSSEYAVSLQSAHAVLTHLDPARYEAIPVGITREGRWFRFQGDYGRIAQDAWYRDPACLTPAMLSPDRGIRGLVEFPASGARSTPLDAVFPVLHGKNGEDGTVQGLAELAGLPLIGCGCLASALCMDKDRAHKLARVAGVDVPESFVIGAGERLEGLERRVQALGYPVLVKPVRAGSSFGVTRVTGPEELESAVRLALEHDSEVILEQAIEGFEVGCAVLGNDTLTCGRVDEIELAGGFFDYQEKYTLQSAHIHMPARIDPDTERRIRQDACAVYRALGCTGFARVDLFLTPQGRIVFNEVNTIPGFTAHSRYPSMMKGVGLSFSQVLDRLIELGVRG